jgi:hypothetical protein
VARRVHPYDLSGYDEGYEPEPEPEPVENADPVDEDEPADPDEDEPEPAEQQPARRTGNRGGGGASVVSSGAGVILGAIAYAGALNFIRGGPSGFWAWVKSKLINKTTAAPKSSGSGGGGPNPPRATAT